MAEWAYVITPEDRELFKRCRRAWDLGSRERQNYEPIKPMRTFDFERAIHDALAVYYFPGMWEWNRAIVLPLVVEGFVNSMQKQKDIYSEGHGLSTEEEQDWSEYLALGEEMLKHYFEWAPTVDRFEPIRVEPELDVNIPDVWHPGQDLVAPGRTPPIPIRYRGRVDLLVVDGYNAYWIVDHRIVEEGWDNIDRLLLDERSIAACWAFQQSFLGMNIAGVIYNELHREAPRLKYEQVEETHPVPSQDKNQEEEPVAKHRRMYVQALRKPNQLVKQQGNKLFRRTQIARSQTELENFGRQIALEALEITDTNLRIYPNPSKENCGNCAFLKPCIAMYEGGDIGALLEASYRKRDLEKAEEGRIGGSTWSMNRGAMPPKLGR